MPTTYRIIIENGKIRKATEPSRKAINIPTIEKARDEFIGLTSGLLASSLAITKPFINEYNSITGRQASVNGMNSAVRYATKTIGLAGSLATGNIALAGGFAVGIGVSAISDIYQFQKNVTDANAQAQYLREQSGTSVNSNRGDYYKFRF